MTRLRKKLCDLAPLRAKKTLVLYIAFNWFCVRPKQIAKQQDKINGLIEKFEAINHQFEDKKKLRNNAELLFSKIKIKILLLKLKEEKHKV